MKKNVMFIVLFLFSISLFFGEVNYSQLEKKLKKTLDAVQKENGFPGATFALAMSDGTIIKLATGYAYPEKKIKMKPEDRMLAGSTGKTYCAAVALQLLEEGKIKLHDKAAKYFTKHEWFKKIPNYDQITIRNLMNHTSGLPRHVFDQEFQKKMSKNRDKIWKPEELLFYILNDKPVHPVGEGWSYSDTDYIILGMIIETVTGNIYYDELKKRILTPLGFKSTSPSDKKILKGLVQGHSGPKFINSPEKVVKDGKYFTNPQFEWTGGGIITNSPELAKWVKTFYSGKLFTKKTMASLRDTVHYRTGKPDPDMGYGLGVMKRKTRNNGMMYGHGGIMPGYLTEAHYFKKYDFSFAMQVNADNFSGKLNKPSIMMYANSLLKVVFEELSSNK